MKKNTVEYNIGLDIGTNSVGWCVTDLQNKILKFKDKKMIGVRLFQEGETAARTRMKRSQRRRYMRRRERIKLLQELLSEMIIPIDNNFFMRLEDSFLFQEDKRVKSSFTLFDDSQYTDKQYYQQFPTIYHLRSTLLNTQEKVDPRWIYLALHHIIKYRGNFLYPGQNFAVTDLDLKAILGELLEKVVEEETYTAITCESMEKIQGLLLEKGKTRKEKQEKVTEQLVQQGLESKLAKELSKAILGYDFNIATLLKDSQLIDENGKELTAKFSDAKYEEQSEKLEELLEENFQVIDKLHHMYSQYVLSSILGGKQYLSEAMIEKYNQHHEDLRQLKALVRKYAPNQYAYLFRKKGIKNYTAYIQGDKQCNQEELYATIKKILKHADPMDEAYGQCMQRITEYTFLMRLNSRENSSIPWQMNKVEMEKIIDQQGKYYPTLKENKDKLVSLLSFKIPYYVGPLNPQTSSRFAWVKRTEEKIYPWNFFKVIKEDETAEAFITRMTNYCTYLPLEKVLPRYSLLYSKFCLLNELANIRVNERRLEPLDKKRIINDLFCHTKKVTDKKLCAWLKQEQWGGQTAFKVTGYQKEGEFASSLGSYIDFCKIFGKVDESNQEMIEQLIYWLTVFEEKSIVQKKIKSTYPCIEDKQLKQILKLRYKGWGNLSKKLLVGLLVKQDERSYSILDQLENTSLNFMQIIRDRQLGYGALIEKEQKEEGTKEITLEDIKGLHGSPALKKGVWQTVKIIQEIVDCMGKEPAAIMMEVAREEGISKRTVSRKNKLLQLYKQFENEIDFYNREVEKQLKSDKYNKQLADERLFLYFIQNGRCMYTGEPLDIDQLQQYEVDHIIPQCYIKDDSIDNKVLVLKKENQRKLDNLLIAREVQIKNRTRWEKLYKHGLISSKKYNNLTRSGLSENEQKGFINRQLVETRQICKQVATLLQAAYVNSNVVLVKAALGHLFREKYNLYKNREVNDFHHAQDAYLSAMIGNTLLLNKECDSAEWIYNDYRKGIKKNIQDRKQKYGYVLSMFDRQIVDSEGQVVWEGESDIQKVLKIFEYKNYLITKKLEEGTGQFYDETIYGRGEKKELIPLKEGLDVAKYGGYSGVKNAYSVVIAYSKAKKTHKVLVGIPVQVAYSLKEGKYTLEEYFTKLGYKEVHVLRKKVLKYQLIQVGDALQYITSSQEVCNAKQLILDKRWQSCIALICQEKLGGLRQQSEEVDELLEYLLSKVKQEYNVFKGVWEKADELRKKRTLELEDKCHLIQEVLKLTRANAQNANFKRIDKSFSDRLGRMQKSVSVTGTTFIDQSITGLFERRESL